MYTFKTRIAVVAALLLVGLQSTIAQDVPFPEPSTNGAQHYNRALLTLSTVPVEDREPLIAPIWQVFGESSKEELKKAIDQVVLHARHAIRAAELGSEQEKADFGIDYAHHGHSAALPHAEPMLQLGRLLTLKGIGEQIDGDWDEAASSFFSSMRLGRHMTTQPTLVESLIGVEILENNYYALAFWATKCPDTNVVKKALARFNADSKISVDPARTFAHETSISDRKIERLKSAYPDGEWSEMLLEALGEYEDVGDNLNHHQEKAQKKCIMCGMPTSAFESKNSFDSYVEKIRVLRSSFLKEVASCINLPAADSLPKAKSLTEKYAPQFEKLGDSNMLDASQVAGFYATHAAQQKMTQVALAMSANRNGDKFPADLGKLGKDDTCSPYDGSPIEYKVLDGGSDISVRIKAADVAGIALPVIEFSSAR